jgi:hypothetical protein
MRRSRPSVTGVLVVLITIAAIAAFVVAIAFLMVGNGP